MSLAGMGQESFTPILGQIVPWDGSVMLGGERIFLTIDHGQIVLAEIPSRGEFWHAGPWPYASPWARIKRSSVVEE